MIVKETPRTLLVIPHYRDTARIEPFLQDLVSVLPEEFTVLVSDDGSGAAEFARLDALVGKVRDGNRRASTANLLPPLAALRNRGKGAAVYAGWREGLRAGHDLLAFADADGAVSAHEILRATHYLCEELHELDAVIGSRLKILGRRVERRLVRHLAGRIFATVASGITGLGVYDTQCGFKLLRAAAFARIEPYVRATRFAFDVEMLMLLAHFGFRTEEFAVDWFDQAGGKVSLLRDPLPMLAEMLAARRRVDALPPND